RAPDRPDPAAPGRRPRVDGALGQLPEGREHLLHRRPDPAHRERVAEDAEPWPQVAERDQGSAGVARTDAWHEARELAARRPRAPVTEQGENAREPSCVTVTDYENSIAPAPIARRCCATCAIRCCGMN